MDEQYLARRSVQDLPKTITALKERIANLKADQATAADHAGDPVVIDGRKCLKDEVPAVLAGKLDALPMIVRETTRVPMGTYRGLNFGLVLHSQVPPDVFLEGSIARASSLTREHQGPRAVLNALERLIAGYGPASERVQQDLGIAESQLRDYQARLGAPFAHDQYLSELTGFRDQLKASLSGKQPEPGSKTLTAGDIAAQIKTLRAAHSIDATPQRAQHKQTTAEEPVTARIRRKMESAELAGNLAEPDAPAEAPHPEGPIDQAILAEPDAPGVPPDDASTPPHGTHQPHMTFQQRLAAERRHQEPEPSRP
jgi:hypothetical protein